MPTAKRLLKVFLCHAHADRDAVRALYTRLINDGVDAWLDKEKLIPGQDWELEIRKAVRESDVVVVCLSKQFNQAGFRQKEVRLALDTAMEKPEGEIFIIPARLEECENLESLGKWHWVDLYEENGYETLLRALQLRAKKIGLSLSLKAGAALKNYQIQGKAKRSFPKEKRKFFILSTFALLSLIALLSIMSFLGNENQKAALISTPTSIVTKQKLISNTPTLEPSTTPYPALTTVTSTFTITPFPTAISDGQGVPMVLIPSGKFTMGSSDSFSNEKPVHLVNLNAYYIDKYEVTNRNYDLCVQNGECLPPKKRSSKTHPSYFGNSDFDNYPVIYVTWNMAQQYCSWRGARLPSEAEWEKAARGVDGRIYPWGDTIKNTEANYNGLVGDLTVVGRYNSGVSPYGLFDMAGNAQEWVNDWYQADYYSSLFGDIQDPQGPSNGLERVIRGGSWDAGKNFIRTTYRFESAPSVSFYNISFRCAKDAELNLANPSETPLAGFDLITIDKVAYRGGTSTAQIQTQPGAACQLGFILPSGVLSQAGGTGPDIADEKGICSWTWEIASNVNPGWGTIYIEVGVVSDTYSIEIK